MRSPHGGEELPRVARGEYCAVRRLGEKTQHPPTHTHTYTHDGLLLRHYSSSLATSTKQSPSPLFLILTVSFSLCMHPYTLSESQHSLHHLLQDAANHLDVCACVRGRNKRTEGGDVNASVVSDSTRTHILSLI